MFEHNFKTPAFDVIFVNIDVSFFLLIHTYKDGLPIHSYVQYNLQGKSVP